MTTTLALTRGVCRHELQHRKNSSMRWFFFSSRFIKRFEWRNLMMRNSMKCQTTQSKPCTRNVRMEYLVKWNAMRGDGSSLRWAETHSGDKNEMNVIGHVFWTKLQENKTEKQLTADEYAAWYTYVWHPSVCSNVPLIDHFSTGKSDFSDEVSKEKNPIQIHILRSFLAYFCFSKHMNLPFNVPRPICFQFFLFLFSLSFRISRAHLLTRIQVFADLSSNSLIIKNEAERQTNIAWKKNYLIMSSWAYQMASKPDKLVYGLISKTVIRTSTSHNTRICINWLHLCLTVSTTLITKCKTTEWTRKIFCCRSDAYKSSHLHYIVIVSHVAPIEIVTKS